MTIGQVVETLKQKFPSVSISKIRFLEDEGLIKPKRTKGGYRVFSEKDVEKIETILTLQTQQFLPLYVIREKLKQDNGALKAAEAEYSEADVEPEDEGEEYFLDELAKKSGASIEKVEDMEKYGLIKGKPSIDGQNMYSASDLKIVSLAKSMERFGIEPRHLRSNVGSVERNIATYKQIYVPLARHRGPNSQKKAKDALFDLKQLIESFEKLLTEREIKTIFQ